MSSGSSKITGEGKVTTFKWFDREASSGPLSPRVSYLLKHLNTEKINAIMNRMNRGEITGDEMIKLLEEETNHCLEGMEEEGTVRRTEEDEGTEEDEEDGEMGKALQLGDHEKLGIVKRPQPSLVESELECKKPRLAQG